MSPKRRADFYGSKILHGLNLRCTYDAGIEGGPACGTPATSHAWPGSAPDTKLDAIVWACDEHFTILEGRLWDWHPVGGACGIPGATWHNGTEQGAGYCWHDLDETTLTTAMIAPERLNA